MLPFAVQLVWSVLAGGRGTATDPKNALNPIHDAARTHTPRLSWSCTAAPRLTQHARTQRASGARARPATAEVEPDGPAPPPCAAGAHSCGLQGRTSRRSTCCCAVRRAPSTRHRCA
eukprot:174429-Prymnesium_polylepis.1